MVTRQSPPGTIYNSSPSRPSPGEVVQIPDAVRARCTRGADTPPIRGGASGIVFMTMHCESSRGGAGVVGVPGPAESPPPPGTSRPLKTHLFLVLICSARVQGMELRVALRQELPHAHRDLVGAGGLGVGLGGVPQLSPEVGHAGADLADEDGLGALLWRVMQQGRRGPGRDRGGGLGRHGLRAAAEGVEVTRGALYIVGGVVVGHAGVFEKKAQEFRTPFESPLFGRVEQKEGPLGHRPE